MRWCRRELIVLSTSGGLYASKQPRSGFQATEAGEQSCTLHDRQYSADKMAGRQAAQRKGAGDAQQKTLVRRTCAFVQGAALQLLDQDGADVALAVLQREHDCRDRNEQCHGPANQPVRIMTLISQLSARRRQRLHVQSFLGDLAPEHQTMRYHVARWDPLKTTGEEMLWKATTCSRGRVRVRKPLQRHEEGVGDAPDDAAVELLQARQLRLRLVYADLREPRQLLHLSQANSHKPIWTEPHASKAQTRTMSRSRLGSLGDMTQSSRVSATGILTY